MVKNVSRWAPSQWLFLVPLKGGRWHIIPQLAVYTTYILVICYLPAFRGTRNNRWPSRSLYMEWHGTPRGLINLVMTHPYKWSYLGPYWHNSFVVPILYFCWLITFVWSSCRSVGRGKMERELNEFAPTMPRRKPEFCCNKYCKRSVAYMRNCPAIGLWIYDVNDILLIGCSTWFHPGAKRKWAWS